MKMLIFGIFCFIQTNSLLAKNQVYLNKKKPTSSKRDTAQLDEVVITATKTLRKLSNLTVPANIINQNYIKQTASYFLQDVLREQASLNVVSYFGDAVQIQGLSGDYTLILINGEPLVGRNSGTLDLSRISIANIQKIEIVKGPSSSLYGSEALAGVINIITKDNIPSNLKAFGRIGNFKQIQANIQGSIQANKIKYIGSADYSFQNGFTVKPFTVGRTATPITRITTSHSLDWTLNTKQILHGDIRYNYNNLKNVIETTNLGTTTISDGSENQKDINTTLRWDYQILKNLKTQIKSYYTLFQSQQNLVNLSGLNYQDVFKQSFWRLESQSNYTLKKLDFVLGFGQIMEQVNTNRYDSIRVEKTNLVKYVFFQTEWSVFKNWTLIGGIRYDNNHLYASAWSPKLSTLIKISPSFQIRASIGKGFKAPDFRQLYLNFTNNAAGSYSVFGANLAVITIQQLQNVGQISYTNEFYSKLSALVPEESVGVNLGFNWFYSKNFSVKTNFFYNNIDNFIDSRLVAVKTNGAQIFSYLNIREIFTQGAEIEIVKKFNMGLDLELGYQYLQTGDRDEIQKIKNGLVFTSSYNNGHLFTKSITLAEYIGLPYRSPHQVTFKILYTSQKQWFANARFFYRSAWGFNDTNGNGVFDVYDDLVPGNYLINIAGGKTFKLKYTLQGGINNVTNYADPLTQPSLLGRNYYLTFTYSLF